jgi:hypothetical protein
VDEGGIERIAVAELVPIRFSHEKHKKSQRKQLHFGSGRKHQLGTFRDFSCFLWLCLFGNDGLEMI